MTTDGGEDGDADVPLWGTPPASPETGETPAWGTPAPPPERGLRALALAWRESRAAKAWTTAAAAAAVLVVVGAAVDRPAETPPSAVAQPVAGAGPVVADQGDLTLLGDLRPDNCAEGGPKGARGVVVVDCSEQHDEEVIGAVDLKPGPWAGDLAVDQEALAACAPGFARYVGIPLGESSFYLGVYAPDEPAWSTGSRTVVCVVEVEEDTVGSVKGSGV